MYISIKRFKEHQEGKGANHTKKRLPVALVYYKGFTRINWALKREKQIQGWSHEKKKALVEANNKILPLHSQCQNERHYKLYRKED